MAPSPRKQAPTTPKKVSQATPTKGTRTSPRKRAWASPVKATAKFQSELFSSNDFADLSNKSWAEITEEDEELSSRLEAERRCKSESRRKGQPKRANQGKSKFVRSLELTNDVFQATSSRRSQRSKSRTRNGEIVETEEVMETIVLETSSGPISRKRCLSNASTINEEGSPSKRRMETGKTNRKAPRARLFNGSESPNVAASPSRKDHWEEPTLGWCTDEAVLKRRSREIDRAKEKAVYKQYISEVSFHDRVKGQHPRTPNKLINYSRRSWDTQIKKWKRSLYEYCGEEPSESVNTSFCSYSDDAMSESGEKEHVNETENRSVLRDLKIPVPARPEVDSMASLLGKFDVDSQMGLDESTLKASSNSDPTAPTDFSKLAAQ
uniref:SLBP_RNA_bind domain-containing protein n=1 Tax=Caenorhabditis tropicalis TaxID=1561998 RepID=A0A1I7THV0_9PELO